MLRGKGQILVVDDEANLRRVLSVQLEREGFEVHTAEDGEQATEVFRQHHVDLIISDLRMPKMDGMGLLRASMQDDPTRPVVIVTAHGTIDSAVEALKNGAFDFIRKPFDKDEVRQIVDKAMRTRELAKGQAHRHASGDSSRFGIIGKHPSVREVYAMIDRVAKAPSTVLITGESGTGKELVARALHDTSARSDKPFIKVNCAAIPRELIESELFGYEKGAFTGAVNAKPGRFELASGGTLFLDEIGEIPHQMQVKLLRVLQESEFERVGGIETLRVDVRLIAATNRDLRKETEQGGFREDLFYRLNVVPIALPSLRERSSDVPDLANFFIERFNERLHKCIEGISPDALAMLLAYGWPGNIRELENVIERAVLFSDEGQIRVEHLPSEIAGEKSVDSEKVGLKQQVRAATAQIERQLIGQALDQTQGNVTHAARLLQISRKGLQLKMKELELRERDNND